MNRSISKIISLAGWGLLLGLVLMAALSLGWELMAWQDFGYRWLQGPIGISATVEQYGPLNSVRPNFQLTSVDERVRLFSAIVEGIHHRGSGLQALQYLGVDGQVLGQLLTRAELVHLNDVARLVSWLRPVGWLAIGLALAGSLKVHFYGEMLSGQQIMAVAIVGIGLAAVVLLLFGAQGAFYWLHQVVFPEGHQWFFYYEESLMSMMMQAPDLFGAIGLVWALLTVVLITGWYRLIR